jgi:hypothetical protein
VSSFVVVEAGARLSLAVETVLKTVWPTTGVACSGISPADCKAAATDFSASSGASVFRLARAA